MRIWFCILLLLLPLLSTGNLQSQGVSNENFIDIEVAINAASRYLPQFYNGEWSYYNHFVYHDLENRPIAYAIVFKKMNSEVEHLEKMKKTMEMNYLEIKNNNERIDAIRNNPQLSGKEKNRSMMELYRKISKIKDSIRGVDRFATVLSGAVDTLPVVLKCHKGMPETFFKELDAREKLSKEFPGKQFNITNVFYLGLFDIFYEISTTDESSSTGSFPSIGEEELLFHLRTGELVSLRDIRTKFEERKLLKKQKSDPSRIKKNKERWGYYRQSKKVQPDNLNVYKCSTSQEKLHLNKTEVRRLSKNSKEAENPQQLPKKEKSRDKVEKENEKKVKDELKKDVGLQKPSKVEKSKEEKNRGQR